MIQYIHSKYKQPFLETLERIGCRFGFKRMDASWGAAIKSNVNLSWFQYRTLGRMLSSYMKTPVLAIEQSVRHLAEDGLIYPG